MSGDRALVPADAQLERTLPAEQVRQIHDEIAAVVAAADLAIATLREIGGPDPGAFANQLAFKMNRGAGFFRSAQADIETAWRARNVAQAEDQKPTE